MLLPQFIAVLSLSHGGVELGDDVSVVVFRDEIQEVGGDAENRYSSTDWNLLMAASLLVILPMLALFLLTQKTFIQGISTTGLK